LPGCALFVQFELPKISLIVSINCSPAIRICTLQFDNFWKRNFRFSEIVSESGKNRRSANFSPLSHLTDFYKRTAPDREAHHKPVIDAGVFPSVPDD
jgi:hypothetical protein